MHRPHQPLIIYVATALGDGSTRLAAFDSALQQAGVADLNLIPLSSIIPPAAQVERRTIPRQSVTFGDRLYCVIASQTTSEPQELASAAIGWTIDSTDGRGLFAEAHGSDETEVEANVRGTLADMQRRRNDGDWGPIEVAQATSPRCEGRPLAAIAIAAYTVEGWVPAW